VNDNCSLLGLVVMGDETWYHQYDSQTKIQSMEWRSPSSKNFNFKSQAKVMLVTFSENQGIIHKEFIPPG
jgi:hypothetical protein